MMGLFDFFKRDKRTALDPPAGPQYANKKVASLGKRAADKKLQPFDREEAIRALINIGTHEAASALLKRFSLKVDPSITDQEEKQLAFDAIISIGRGERGKRVSDAGKDAKEISSDPLTNAEVIELGDAIIDATHDYCDKAENLTWPLKVMRALLDDASYEAELLERLSRWDTEYTRNVEPKLNILAAMESVQSETIRAAVHEYLDDVNETVRFHAVQTTFSQDIESSVEMLVAMTKNEESVRVKNKVCDGIMKKGWVIPADCRDDWNDATSDVYEYDTDASGKIGKA